MTVDPLNNKHHVYTNITCQIQWNHEEVKDIKTSLGSTQQHLNFFTVAKIIKLSKDKVFKILSVH